MQIQTQEHIQQKGESRNMLCHSQAMQINGTGFPSSSAIDLYFGGPFWRHGGREVRVSAFPTGRRYQNID
jgi:hypothetical protein